ncbi:MAG TPA: phage holin family protein [Acidimicrobiales bacterium]
MNVSPWLVRIVVAAAANAVMLLVAAALFDRIEIDPLPFVVAVAIFTLAAIVVKPIAERLAGRYASGVTWVAGLVTTYVALLVTDIFSDGLSIEGIGTWIGGTVVVWIGTLIYDVVDDRLIASVSRHLTGPGAGPQGSTA